MKHFSWGGTALPFAKHRSDLLTNQNINTRVQFFKVGSAMLLALFCFMSSGFVQAQVANQSAIQPLNLGDKIPDSLWEEEFEVVGHPEGKTSIKLSDYRDKKLIILDFWATWCSTCIGFMPTMHKLVDDMDGQVALLSLTQQPRDAIEKFLKETASPQIAEVKDDFVSIVNNTSFRAYFPTKSIPYVVVLDQSGKARALASPWGLNKDVLVQLIADPFAQPVPQKIREVTKPLMADWTGNSDGIFYSAIMPFNAALGFNGGFKEYKGQYAHYHLLNTQPIKMFAEAISGDTLNAKTAGLAITPSRRIFEMEDADLYDERKYARDGEYFLFGFDAVLPYGTTKAETLNVMRRDLELRFGLTALYEERNMPCLILKVIDRNRVPFASANLPRKTVNAGYTEVDRILVKDMPNRKRSSSYMQTKGLGGLVYRMNSYGECTAPFVIDETGIQDMLDLDLVDNLADIPALKKVLNKQGLDLIQDVRPMLMFVLRDPKYKRLSDQLVLVDAGYTYAKDGKGAL